MPGGLGINALMGGFSFGDVPWPRVPGGGGSRGDVPATDLFPLHIRVVCVVLR